MSLVLLSTRLKVADPTARTALATLRDRLGLAGRIETLAREELFLFDIDATPDGAASLVTDLVRRTNLFLNPNKQSWRIALETTAGDPPVASTPAAWLLIMAADESIGLEESVHRHLGLPALRGIERGWLWTFTGPDGVSSEELVDAVRRAGTVHDRHSGFLVHPAFQSGRLYAERPTVYDVRDAFRAAEVAARS